MQIRLRETQWKHKLVRAKKEEVKEGEEIGRGIGIKYEMKKRGR